MEKEIYHNEKTGKWFHWDETWRYKYGPFDTYEEAKKALNEYAEWLNDSQARDP